MWFSSRIRFNTQLGMPHTSLVSSLLRDRWAAAEYADKADWTLILEAARGTIDAYREPGLYFKYGHRSPGRKYSEMIRRATATIGRPGPATGSTTIAMTRFPSARRRVSPRMASSRNHSFRFRVAHQHDRLDGSPHLPHANYAVVSIDRRLSRFPKLPHLPSLVVWISNLPCR